MTLQEYADNLEDFSSYPHAGSRNAMAVNYCAIGMSSEVGEALGEVKKAIRDDKFGMGGRALEADRRFAAELESGDVMFYLFRFIYEIGCDVEGVARANLAKLDSRYCDPKSKCYKPEIAERRKLRAEAKRK